MAKNGGRNEKCGSRWKLDSNVKIPKDQMPALGGVVVPKRSDRAPSGREVEMVSVYVCDGSWAEVTSRTGKDVVLEIAFEVRILVA